MDAYIYQAALYCEDCGKRIIRDLTAAGEAPEDPGDETTFDSDDFPKGPYPDGGGEADSPQHCDGCQVFLENPLTADGDKYVIETVIETIKTGRLGCCIKEWVEYYDISIERILDHINRLGVS